MKKAKNTQVDSNLNNSQTSQPKPSKKRRLGKHITDFVIVYLLIGLFFAIAFAFYYHWGAFSFFSPGFYVVVLTWPFQLPGFLLDLRDYGITGKPIY